MTLIDTTFFYGSPPSENAWRALEDVRDVYGIHQLTFDEKARVIYVEYDASRLTQGDVAGLLRDAGMDLQTRVWDT
jgi:hypothetical protein